MRFEEQGRGAEGIVAYGFLAEEEEKCEGVQNRFIQVFHSAADVRKTMSCSASDLQVLICEGTSECGSISEVSPLNLAAALHKDNPFRDIYIQRDNPQSLFVSRLEAAGARGVVCREEGEKLLGMCFGRKEVSTQRDDVLNDSAQRDDRQKDCIQEDNGQEDNGQEDNGQKDNGQEDCVQKGCWQESCGQKSCGRKNDVDPATTRDQDQDDLAWLEQVLELDDLDELSGVAGHAVLERPVWHPDIVEFESPASSQMAVTEQQTEGSGIVAAFISGRGGVGKSSLTVLTAFDLWLKGSRVVMIDLDLQFGDVGVLAGNEPESRIQRVGIEQVCTNRMRIPGLEGSLLLLEAPQNPELAEELIHQVSALLTALRKVADIVLINTSCLWNEMAAVLASSVDKLVICMDQRATSITATRQVVDLCIRLHIPSTHLYFLLNRCARNAPITDIDASLAMGGVKIRTVADGGADVDELLSLGCPLELLSSRSPLRQSIRELGASLLEKPGVETDYAGGYVL